MARRRWVHLLLGGALLMPYFLLMTIVLGLVEPGSDPQRSTGRQLLAYGLCLPLVALTALLPLVRTLATAAAQALGGIPAERLAGPVTRSRADRWRTVAWFTLHVGVGAPASGAFLAVPPAAAVLVALPLSPGLQGSRLGWLQVFSGPAVWVAPLAGLALLAALLTAVAGAGALLARCAPPLLGPSPADRLAAAEERAAALAARNRLARELHDSVGHALSAVTLQASAARRVLESDPGFAARALAAIEETTRRSVGELDAVLGVLREDLPGGEEPARTLAGPLLSELDRLLSTTRAAGTTVELSGGRDPAVLGELPVPLSREAYRIVQEGLTNVLRHAGPVPITLYLDRDDKELTISMTNPLTGPLRPRRGGGRGLSGVAERAALLGGGADWGRHGDSWRLTVRLPLDGDW